jgi:hypothetical protein
MPMGETEVKCFGPREPNEGPRARGDWFPEHVERRIGQTLFVVVLILSAILGVGRVINLTHDIPAHAPLLGYPGKYLVYSWDGDVYGDEGFYNHDAMTWFQDGVFYLEKDYNQFINLPVMQFIKAGFFLIFGMNLVAARLVTVVSMIVMAVATYFLVRRYEDWRTSLLAVFLLLTNHYLFVFTRYAIDEIPVAMWVTLAMAFAVRVRGPKWWVYAILTSVTFSFALLTKYNSVFATPLVGLLVIIQELDWKKIGLKFLLCSAIFFAIMGTWYVALVRPHMEEFQYFFSLNLNIAASAHPVIWWHRFRDFMESMPTLDRWLVQSSVLVTPLLLFLSRRYRLSPLTYLSIAWVVLYMVMYSYYGRFFPRFWVMTVPPVAVWGAVSMRYLLDMRGPFRLGAYLFVVVIALSTGWQGHRIASAMAADSDSHNEMARDILRIVEADPSGNRVIMGHGAGALALRNGLKPRHDRYGMTPLRERLEEFKPGWVLADALFRISPNDAYSGHVEWYELLFDMELMASYDVYENFRGDKTHLYKLTPRENVVLPEQIVRAQLLGIESVSEKRRREAGGESSEAAAGGDQE